MWISVRKRTRLYKLGYDHIYKYYGKEQTGNQLSGWLVVQKVDNATYWINLYPLDSAIGFPNT